MKKNGFTLIEILAVIVIIGIISIIGVIAVSSNIAESRDASVVDLAKNYAEAARTLRGKGDLYYEPKNGEAVIIPYSQVNGTEIENKDVTGYGDILPSYCFVGIVNNNNNYTYYVNQMDEGYHMLDRAEYNSVSKDDILVGVEEAARVSLPEIKAPFNDFHITYGNDTYEIKALKAKYNVTFSTPGMMKFGSKNVAGRILIESNKVTVFVESSSVLSVPKGEYEFTTQGNMDGYNKVWSRTGGNFKVAIKQSTPDEALFSFINTSNKPIVEDIKSTSKTMLSGYYTKDSSYVSSSANHKGNIALFDTFMISGKFNNIDGNTITYKNVKYTVNNTELLTLILKKI